MNTNDLPEWLREGMRITEEREARRAERDERRWVESHPNAVKEFLDATRAIQATVKALPAPPQGGDRKTLRRAKHTAKRLTAMLQEYRTELEKV